MRINKLRELIDADKPSFGMNVTVDSPDVVEIIGKTGLVDYIEFEAEYMPYSLHSLDNLARYCLTKSIFTNLLYASCRAIWNDLDD